MAMITLSGTLVSSNYVTSGTTIVTANATISGTGQVPSGAQLGEGVNLTLAGTSLVGSGLTATARAAIAGHARRNGIGGIVLRKLQG